MTATTPTTGRSVLRRSTRGFVGTLVLGLVIAQPALAQPGGSSGAATAQEQEISLTSNEQILGVKAATSQFPIYRRAGVPVVLSTDDAGIERIDLTHEYAKAHRWFDLTYDDLKDLSYQSIESSFVSDLDRKRLLKKLDARFAAFEKKWAQAAAA